MVINNSKSRLYESVDCIRRSFGLSISDQMDAVALAEESSNTKLYYRKFNTCGLGAVSFPGETYNTIILNRNRSPESQNFDCAHEIVHLKRHGSSGQEPLHCFDGDRRLNSFKEWEANEGAAQLLIPYQDFIPRFLSGLDYRMQQNGYPVIAELANHYFVPDTVIELRVKNLSYEIWQNQRGVPIQNIELRSSSELRTLGIVPPDYIARCYFAPLVSQM